VTDVSVLHRREVVRLDKNHLIALYAQMDETAAEDLICGAMEELAVCITAIRNRAAAGDRMGVRTGAVAVAQVAAGIGMISLRQVALDVVQTSRSGDAHAHAATVARLIRVSDQSLTEVWDIHDVCL
jgi:hypothetical protein